MMKRLGCSGGCRGGVFGAILLLVILANPVFIHGTFAFERSLVVAPAVKNKGRLPTLQLFAPHHRHQQQHVTSSSSSSTSFASITPAMIHRPYLAVQLRGGASTRTALPAAAVVIPSLKTIALSCLLPTSLGYIKSEYGVSYGYGTSIAILAFIILQQQLGVGSMMTILTTTTTTKLWSSWPALHAAALLFYGIRLDIFLLYRELCIPRFRKFRETIEQKAATNRLARTPFVVSCALLYACMASPLFVTATTTISSATAASSTALAVMKTAIGITWAGFLLAALGDLTKSWGKSRRGENVLITNGVFRWFRHPNYTGEAIAWTASCVAAFAAAFADNSWKVHAYSLIASTVGLAGILFVLAGATKGLTKKQEDKYGESDEYKQWIKRSWVGISL